MKEKFLNLFWYDNGHYSYLPTTQEVKYWQTNLFTRMWRVKDTWSGTEVFEL